MLFTWLCDLFSAKYGKESIMFLLVSERCCGLYSVRVGTLFMILVSILFSSCIVALNLIIWKQPDSNMHYGIPNQIPVYNTSLDGTDHFLAVCILILAGSLMVISVLGLVGVTFEWSILLLPYGFYQFCWFLVLFVLFLPFFIVEFVVLIILLSFPTCPSVLIVFTWIINIVGGIVEAVLALEFFIVLLQFHLTTIVFGCYQELKLKLGRVDETTNNVTSEGSDNSMHEAIVAQREQNYQTVIHNV